MSTCKECGGDMVGDGYTSVMHCEYADESKYDLHEPDADPVYCDYGKVYEAENSSETTDAFGLPK